MLFAVLLGISLIRVFELYRAMGVHQKGFGPLEIADSGTVLYYLTLLWTKSESFSTMVILFTLVLIMCVYVFYYPRYRAEQIMAALFGMVYVAVMLSYIYKTRILEGGAWLVGLIFLVPGEAIPALTVWECSLANQNGGGVKSKEIRGRRYRGCSRSGASGCFVCFGHCRTESGRRSHTVMYALICAVGALISMVGDLAASAIKRNKEIKDYGTLIPGHGGILDRFDSVIFTAPFIYFLASVLI